MGEDTFGMVETKWTADEIELGIAKALKAGDMTAVEGLLKLLITVDVDRAQAVYDVLKLGVGMAKKAAEQGGTDA